MSKRFKTTPWDGDAGWLCRAEGEIMEIDGVTYVEISFSEKSPTKKFKQERGSPFLIPLSDLVAMADALRGEERSRKIHVADDPASKCDCRECWYMRGRLSLKEAK